MKKGIFIIILLMSSHIYAIVDPVECALLRSRDAGMFSIFQEVISLLQHYEKGFFKYIKVDFAKEGQYYDPNHGPNWWEYYFEQISHNHQSQDTKEFYYIDSMKIQFCNSRQYCNYLMEKYIHIKPHIQDKINSFIANHFKDAEIVIGVHYRGTDKISTREAPRVPYAVVADTLKQQIENISNKNYLIFIATDEMDLVHYLNEVFPGKICVNMEAHKSNSNYEKGVNALMDCVLLSKTALLIRTDSNLSLVSSYFNPQVPVIELSKAFWQPPKDWCKDWFN